MENALWNYPVPIEGEGVVDVRDYVAFYWDKMDSWFEEDEEVFVHARDPFTRIDCLKSSRHVKVSISDCVVAETSAPVILFETGLPPRYYIPKQDVEMALLRKSEKLTRCAYKGEEHYYSVDINDQITHDLAWFYRYPTSEASDVANHICFPQGKVDIYVDGVLLEKPKTRWD